LRASRPLDHSGGKLPVLVYLYLAQIVLAIAIIAIVLVQLKDAGMSNMFGGGGDMGVYKTRRGVEKTLFNATIILGSLFMLLCLVTVLVAG
jgi:preprotein translocase subunit SecG